MPQRIESTCSFCFRKVMVNRSNSRPPKVDDDAGWDELLEQPVGYGHKEDCPWVVNRAYQNKPAYKQGFRE